LKRKKRMSLIKIEPTPMNRSRRMRLFLRDPFNSHKTIWKRFTIASKIYGWKFYLRQRKRR